MGAEVGALGEVLGQQAIGVLVGAALPGAVRVTEVDRQADVDPQLGVLASSAPWSQVRDRRSWSGKVVIEAAIASRTASAPWPASAGPFLIRGWPCPVMRGRCNSMVKRVVHSTRVPIAELPRQG